MLGLVKSCIGTKFTSQFGDLIAVSVFFVTELFYAHFDYRIICIYHQIGIGNIFIGFLFALDIWLEESSNHSGI